VEPAIIGLVVMFFFGLILLTFGAGIASVLRRLQ